MDILYVARSNPPAIWPLLLLRIRWYRDGLNINFENNQINIVNREGTKALPPFNVKDYESRSVPMPEWVSSLLIDLQSVAEENCPFVFLTNKIWSRVKSQWDQLRISGNTDEWENRRVMWSALRNFKRYCIKAGIKTDKKITLHCLRKAYGTNLANASTPVHTLKELMGHSSIQTTMEFYLLSSDENKKKAAEQLNSLMGEEVVKSVK